MASSCCSGRASTAHTLLLWLAPFAVLLIGAIGLIAVRCAAGRPERLPADAEARIDALLDEQNAGVIAETLRGYATSALQCRVANGGGISERLRQIACHASAFAVVSNALI